MAGQPLKRACHRELALHEDTIFERLACGAFVTDLCRLYLSEPYEEAGRGDPNTYHFYSWLDEADGRRERFDRVREAAADGLAEESVSILDDLAEEGVTSTAEASLAKARSHSRQWWASKLNREKYGEGRQEVGVQVSIGELHLDALRQKGHLGKHSPDEDELEEIEAVEGRDYEIEETTDPPGSDGDLGKREYGELPKRG